MSIRLHERYFIVETARGKLESALIGIREEHELTFGECVSILSCMLASLAKYAIRRERHGDDQQAGDEE